MTYRELTPDDLAKALLHLGTTKSKDLIYVGEEMLNPKDLLEGLGVNCPDKQSDPLSFLENEENYPWKELMEATVPPIVVVNGYLADGFHRCRVCSVLGLKVKAILYKRK